MPRKPRQKKLGKNLEWNGSSIRVSVTVPPSRRAAVGAAKLHEKLETTDPLEAEREKVEVIKRLRERIEKPRGTSTRIIRDLTEEALSWRGEIANDDDRGTAVSALDDQLGLIRREAGSGAARTYAAIATGSAIPLTVALAPFFREMRFARGYSDDITRAVRRLETWLLSKEYGATVEAVSRRVAGEFIHETMVTPNQHRRSSNRYISCLATYWRFLGKRWGIAANPWESQSLETRRARSHADLQNGPQSADKRAFTDVEVATLLAGVAKGRAVARGSVASVLPDFCRLAALTGMRVDEAAALTVGDICEGVITVPRSKTVAGYGRTIPVHPELVELISARVKNKKAGEYLFDELPEQAADSKRGRGAPVSQVFTRERRRLKVDERPLAGQRQSNIDFHSFRRWFVRKAVGALEAGVTGYTVWTIAEVVGHEVENASLEGQKLPLGMTMSRYSGDASDAAKRACIEAVKLPLHQR